MTTTKSKFLENVKSLSFAIIAALLIRTVAIEPYKIPSSSMKPTLQIGDYVFVLKYAYGYSRHSMPFAPKIFEGRIFEKPAKRGDVIVFKFPKNDSVYYIKRLVGLPGDKVQMRNGVLFINNKPIEKIHTGEYNDEEYSNVNVYNEKLDDTVFQTLDIEDDGPLDNTREFLVPDGQYFFMGDNRDRSNDSRMDVGFVPAENLVGKAKVIFFSISGSFWDFIHWYKNIRFNRIFTTIK